MHTVLVVDDSQQNRELIRSILEPEFMILEAEDGATALDLVTSNAVDLVLLDVMMPGLTGFEVSRRLREARRGEYLPILLLTSLTETSDRLAGFEAGADDFISKPIDTRELRSRVRAFARTRRLHQERAAMADDLARLHDLKDDLAALLVHDLRNPLAGLMAHLDLLQLEALSDQGRASLADAAGAATRLSDMVDDLLQVRLLEDGARTVDRVPDDLTVVVDGAVRTFDQVAAARRVHLSFAPRGRVTLAFDAGLVRRAVENLVANAVRHTRRDGRVDVHLEEEPTAVRVVVCDEGDGIPVEQRPLLFAKYGGRELRKSGRRSGHGLGLYLVGLVMHAHGGTVVIDEANAQGTCVVMTFPRDSAAETG